MAGKRVSSPGLEQPALAGDPQEPPPGGSLSTGANAVLAAVVDLLLRYAMVALLVGLAIAGAILSPGFLSYGNIKIILSQNAAIGLVSIGMTFVIISAGFDLSVGAIFALGGVLGAKFALDMAVPLAVVLAILLGLVAGLFNGLIITRFRVNPFVATLGTASVFSGLAYIYSDNQPVLPSVSGWSWLGYGKLLGLPVSIVILLVVFAVAWVVLAKTLYGNAIFVVGGNSEAAHLSGRRVKLTQASAYVITGGLAVLAGLITASQTGVGQANVGAEVTLDSIAIVVIGGTSLFGGEGAMWRTGVGLLILAMMNNLFESLGLEQAVQSVVKGVVIIAAVMLDVYTRSRRAR